MRFPRVRVGAVATLALGAMLVLSSCTCKIKDEQLSMIKTLRAGDKQLNADITKAEGDKSRIANELSSRESEVRRCNEKKAFVQDKLSAWPNAWGDWDPNAVPPAPVAPAPTKKMK